MKFWIITLTLLLAVSFTMCACSHENGEPENKEEPTPPQTPDTTTGNDTDNNTPVNTPEDMDNNYAKFPLAEGKNGEAPTIRLSSGYDMPIVGLGTYSLTGDVCVNSVKSAISLGFRKIDTAHMYGNEVEVGRGVRESGVPREEIFVATKIYPNQYSDPEKAIEECINKLNIGYVDLMLLHHPGTNDVKAYEAMEKFV